MGSLEHFGRIIRLIGWAIVLLITLLWIIMPIGQMLMNIKQTEEIVSVLKRVLWGTNGEELIKLAVAFIVGGGIIFVGGYIREYDLKKRIEKENTILGYLKLAGRTSLDDLATKVGLSSSETAKMLSELRQNKDVVFYIEGNEVYMPGYERERPKEKETVREVVKEVVKIPCPHCGMLNEVVTEKCVNCGAFIKAK